jgi:ferritin-like protein
MLNEPALQGLLEESQDLHSDAMREVKPALAGLTELHHDSPTQPLDTATVARINEERRGFANRTTAALAGAGLLSTGIGASLVGLLASPASADEAMDIQILQTATSLELLAVATYGAALELPFIADGNAVVKTFAETTMGQHKEHGEAFAASTKALGGKEQTAPNAKYLAVVEETKPKLVGPGDVVALASALEEVATDTYLANLALLTDSDAKALFASVMGVECQHLAILRAVGALVAGGEAGVALIAIPTDVAALPAAAGSVAFPKPFEEPDMASPPAEGAVT